ncbi:MULTISPECIES: SIR2 family protein [unclassified Corallococcus]|uniref:SIR2 family protein n=1 Tax=unclassified Corallococcus TaxID=2685029 RepID=UPI001A8F3DF8|nr:MULTISPECIES: SIR2 family protein [unclassified Corallococcus]MBN9687244.1 SIR2 family protein [Corallococcus sp. NCSPR001]WAS88928.1 SIR2 family protein [Corallococcus sp. NCRR]
MWALLTHLEKTIGPGLSADDSTTWNDIKKLFPSKGLEGALLERPPSPSLESKIVAETSQLVLTHERETIAKVFTGEKTLRLTELFKRILKPPDGIPLITTNYDRLVEIAAEEAGLGADTMFIGQFAGALNESESRLSFCREVKLANQNRIQTKFRDRVNIYKPHGSLDWYHRAGRPVRYSGDLDAPRLIITPGLNKFRNGYESPFDRHREKANVAIDKASRFLIIGYGFNDEHLETHLTHKIRNGCPTLLLTHSLTPNAAKLAQNFPNVISLEHSTPDPGSTVATRVTVNKKTTTINGIEIWDLGKFVTEVLGP